MGLFSTPPKNGEDNSPIGAPPKNPESLDRVHGEVISEAPAKRGRGRPPGSKTGASRPMVGKTAAGPQAEPEIVVSPEDVEFIRTIALAGLNLLDRVEVQIICNAINEINEPLLKEKTDVYLRTREITEADERIVGDSAAALAVKYPIITRYAPEGALIGWGIQHFAKFQSVVAEIKRVGAQIIQARKNGPPADAN